MQYDFKELLEQNCFKFFFFPSAFRTQNFFLYSSVVGWCGNSFYSTRSIHLLEYRIRFVPPSKHTKIIIF